VAELLWFIEGSSDERRLAELTHGTRDGTVTIWTPNSLAAYWQPRAKFPGDLGRVYGVQWRHWRAYRELQNFGASHYGGNRVAADVTEIDQLQQLIHSIQTAPDSRRHVLTAWNPAELDQMALPPCHMFAQFYVSDGRLSCQMYQRSGDMFLGVPFNIASYALLTHMVAQVCGLGVGELVHVLGDAHIYQNHLDQVRQQLSRTPLPGPSLWLNPDIKNIEDFTMADIRLENYHSHGAIKADMAV
jgi:thymidylate synthase